MEKTFQPGIAPQARNLLAFYWLCVLGWAVCCVLWPFLYLRAQTGDGLISVLSFLFFMFPVNTLLCSLRYPSSKDSLTLMEPMWHLLVLALIVALPFTPGRIERQWERSLFYTYRAAPTPKPPLRVLFVGDGHTAEEGAPEIRDLIPGMVSRIAAADKKAPRDIAVFSFTANDTTLAEMFDSRKSMPPHAYDIVVLQESRQALLKTPATDLSRTLKSWAGLLAPAKARLLQIWPVKPGAKAYGKNGAPLNAADMQSQLGKTENSLARQLRMPVSDTGRAFLACDGKAGVPDLYLPDDSLPSDAGVYLAALILYRDITGHAIADVSFTPEKITPAQAAALRACAE